MNRCLNWFRFRRLSCFIVSAFFVPVLPASLFADDYRLFINAGWGISTGGLGFNAEYFGRDKYDRWSVFAGIGDGMGVESYLGWSLGTKVYYKVQGLSPYIGVAYSTITDETYSIGYIEEHKIYLGPSIFAGFRWMLSRGASNIPFILGGGIYLGDLPNESVSRAVIELTIGVEM